MGGAAYLVFDYQLWLLLSSKWHMRGVALSPFLWSSASRAAGRARGPLEKSCRFLKSPRIWAFASEVDSFVGFTWGGTAFRLR